MNMIPIHAYDVSLPQSLKTDGYYQEWDEHSRAANFKVEAELLLQNPAIENKEFTRGELVEGMELYVRSEERRRQLAKLKQLYKKLGETRDWEPLLQIRELTPINPDTGFADKISYSSHSKIRPFMPLILELLTDDGFMLTPPAQRTLEQDFFCEVAMEVGFYERDVKETLGTSPKSIPLFLVTLSKKRYSIWLVSLFIKFLIRLREDIRSHRYRSRLYRRNRRIKENIKSCKKYIAQLRKRYPRLLVIRLDLSYLKEVCGCVSYEEFFAMLDLLLLNRRDNGIFKGFVGYIRKLEWGQSKGPHAHFLMFFDGSVRRPSAHAYIAQQICDYWLKLTDGKGCAYNCNSELHKYQFPAIGYLHRSNDQMYDALDKIITYLCKDEQCNTDYYPSKAKMMTRGHLEQVADVQQLALACHNKGSP